MRLRESPDGQLDEVEVRVDNGMEGGLREGADRSGDEVFSINSEGWPAECRDPTLPDRSVPWVLNPASLLEIPRSTYCCGVHW